MFDGIEKKDDKTVTVKVEHPQLLAAEGAPGHHQGHAVLPLRRRRQGQARGFWPLDVHRGLRHLRQPWPTNPNYNGEFPAKDNELRIESLTDTTARVTAQQEGTTLVTESVPPESIDQLKAAGCDVDQVNGFGTRFAIIFNVKKAPWDDVKVQSGRRVRALRTPSR